MEIAERLWEIEQIKQLKARFFRLLDTHQWELWKDCFTEDLEVHVIRERSDDERETLLRNGATGRDELVQSRAQHVGTSRHHGHMPEIELTGPTTATGIWASFSYTEHADGSTTQFCGWYEDEYRKDDDAKWRIRRMRITGLTPISS